MVFDESLSGSDRKRFLEVMRRERVMGDEEGHFVRGYEGWYGGEQSKERKVICEREKQCQSRGKRLTSTRESGQYIACTL